MKTLAFLLFAAAATTPAKKVHYTYWQPPKLKPDDPMRVFPGMNVPQNHEQYTWAIKKGGARVVGFDALGRGSVLGSAPEGTEVKLTAFRQTNGTIYYPIPFTNAKGEPVTGWVNGHMVVVKSLNTAPANDSKRLKP